MTNKNNFRDELSSSMTGGRLRRYAKVTSAMGGLAARLAGEKYLGIKIDREQHASDLRAALKSEACCSLSILIPKYFSPASLAASPPIAEVTFA